MRGATPEQYHLARWLLAHEAGNLPNRDAAAEAAEVVHRKLRQPLARLLGPAGFDALLLRALDLSVSQFPFLKGIGPAQQREGLFLGGAAQGHDPHHLAEGFATLFAHLLWLLATFIGEDLAWQQVAMVWPEAPLDSKSGGGETKE